MTQAKMANHESSIGDFVYRIDDSASKQDIRQWYALVSNSGCSVEFVAKGPFAILNTTWRHLDLGKVCINYIYNARPFRAVHKPDLREKQQNRNFKLVYTNIGTTLHHCGQTANIPAESFFLMDNTHSFEFEIDTESSIGISLNLQADWLIKYVPNPKLALAVPYSAKKDWGMLLLQTLKAIEKQNNLQSASVRSLIANQLGSLLALLMLPNAALLLQSKHQISFSALLERVLHDNYQQPDLSADKVAAMVGISRRHLFNIYAKTSSSFSNTLLRIRLENAQRMLLDERYNAFRICEVAWSSGFSDISHFSRKFKAHYAMAPSALRRQGVRSE
jgi:AraC family transcriptional regulator, positive regulator of tynA and feaB